MTPDEEIQNLRKLLETQRTRAEQAEERRKTLEQENQSLKDQLTLVRAAAPRLFEMGSSILTTLQTCCKDIPEAEFEAFREAMSNTLSEFDRLPQARIMARLFAKDSEKLTLNQFEKARRKFNNAAKNEANNIKRGHSKLAKSMEATAKATAGAADVSPAVKSIAEIERIPGPPSPEFGTAELLGKRTAVALRDAPVQTAQELARCPNCHSTDLEQGTEFCSKLRTLSADFNSLADLLEIRGPHVLCRHCNEVHYVCGSDVPAVPGRPEDGHCRRCAQCQRHASQSGPAPDRTSERSVGARHARTQHSRLADARRQSFGCCCQTHPEQAACPHGG